MDIAPLAFLSALILVKEAGIPIPVPGDLLVIGAGVSTSGRPEALVWLAAILLAGYAGGCIQFLLVRGPMRRPILGLLGRVGIGERRLEQLADPLCHNGARAVAISRATPGVRVPAIAASAVAALPLGVFTRGLVAGNTVFVGGHFALGYVVGAPAARIGSALASPATAAAAVIALALVGAAGWLLIRRRRSAEVRADAFAESSFPAWADAACPACLAIAAVRRAGSGTREARAAG
jgi:membrane-associated protein